MGKNCRKLWTLNDYSKKITTNLLKTLAKIRKKYNESKTREKNWALMIFFLKWKKIENLVKNL
jgi:hypothetical protein